MQQPDIEDLNRVCFVPGCEKKATRRCWPCTRVVCQKHYRDHPKIHLLPRWDLPEEMRRYDGDDGSVDLEAAF